MERKRLNEYEEEEMIKSKMLDYWRNMKRKRLIEVEHEEEAVRGKWRGRGWRKMKKKLLKENEDKEVERRS